MLQNRLFTGQPSSITSCLENCYPLPKIFGASVSKLNEIFSSIYPHPRYKHISGQLRLGQNNGNNVMIQNNNNKVPDLTIVVPCYNERENILPLVGLLDKALLGLHWNVIFVDDDSPDGTAKEVRRIARERHDVRLLHRVGRRGLSGACIEGILSSISSVVAVIDGDLQHDESKLAEMFAIFSERPEVDVVIGSRNIEEGSSIGGLSVVREWGSTVATKLARQLLKITASDPLSGFFMVRREKFNEVVTDLQVAGFKILVDMLVASKGSWNVVEVGYEFRARRHGESKMDTAITLEFFGLILSRITGGIFPIRLILFLLVGLIGVAVQLSAVRLAMWTADLPFYIAQILGVWCAMTSNFALNNILTYRDRMLRGVFWLRGLLSFYVVCFFGALANVGVAELLFETYPNWLLASFAGAVVGALWNFMTSARVTWRVR